MAYKYDDPSTHPAPGDQVWWPYDGSTGPHTITDREGRIIDGQNRFYICVTPDGGDGEPEWRDLLGAHLWPRPGDHIVFAHGPFGRWCRSNRAIAQEQIANPWELRRELDYWEDLEYNIHGWPYGVSLVDRVEAPRVWVRPLREVGRGESIVIVPVSTLVVLKRPAANAQTIDTAIAG